MPCAVRTRVQGGVRCRWRCTAAGTRPEGLGVCRCRAMLRLQFVHPTVSHLTRCTVACRRDAEAARPGTSANRAAHSLSLAFFRLLVIVPLIIVPLPEFIHSALVDAVDPPLIEEDHKDDVIPKARHAVQSWHLDDEREKVVDESVESFVPGTRRCMARSDRRANQDAMGRGRGEPTARSSA